MNTKLGFHNLGKISVHIVNAGVVQAPDALYRVPEFKSYSINIVLWAPCLSPGKAYF